MVRGLRLLRALAALDLWEAQCFKHAAKFSGAFRGVFGVVGGRYGVDFGLRPKHDERARARRAEDTVYVRLPVGDPGAGFGALLRHWILVVKLRRWGLVLGLG